MKDVDTTAATTLHFKEKTVCKLFFLIFFTEVGRESLNVKLNCFVNVESKRSWHRVFPEKLCCQCYT